MRYVALAVCGQGRKYARMYAQNDGKRKAQSFKAYFPYRRCIVRLRNDRSYMLVYVQKVSLKAVKTGKYALSRADKYVHKRVRYENIL